MTTPAQPTARDREIALKTRQALVGCVDLDEEERIIAVALARARAETIEWMRVEIVSLCEETEAAYGGINNGYAEAYRAMIDRLTQDFPLPHHLTEERGERTSEEPSAWMSQPKRN